ARSDRQRRCARRGARASIGRRDPASDGREHLPLRHLPQDRGGDPHLARLIRTEKEVEGRLEEVWLVVDEDALDQWPAGPRDVVGRAAARNDGLARARGEARYTADVSFPGMLHAVVLRSPHAHARVKRIDLAPALAMPGVRAGIGPGDAPELSAECAYQGAPVAAVCADSLAQARDALASVEVEWEVLEPLLDPDVAVAGRAPVGPPPARGRRRRDRAH